MEGVSQGRRPRATIRIVEQFVSEGVGGIVLAPIDDTALKRPVAAAMQKGIPVVIMDSPLKGESVKDFVSTVSTNTTAVEKWLASSWKAFRRQRQGGALSL